MTRRSKMQMIKVMDHGDDWVNRLAVIGNQFEKMESAKERGAALRFFIAKYRADLRNEQSSYDE